MVENDKVENLLIIGNGFDLARELHTSFINYINEYSGNNFQNEKDKFNKFLEDLQNYLKKMDGYSILNGPNDFNYAYLSSLFFDNEKGKKFTRLSFWDMYMLTKKFINPDNTTDWADIELNLHNFFVGDHNLNDLLNSTDTDNNILSENELINFKDDYFYFQLIVFRYISYDFQIKNQSDEIYYKFLLNQLNNFENNFKEYLTIELNEKSINRGVYVKESREKLIDEILNGISDGKFNLINFNYDRFVDSRCKNKIHIHGSLNEKIIIGFDSTSIEPSKPFYQFTKTSRIMERSLKQNEYVLSDDIKNIIFYGHSLADADNSYFKAIFDKYNLYDNPELNLYFCYTVYDTGKTQMIRSSIRDSVVNLIFNYGKTLNDSHGENILPKLLLENRLHLKEVPKIYM